MTVRPIRSSDASIVNELSAQLGYPMSAATTKDRIEIILMREDHQAFVAVIDEQVVGWIHLYVTHILEASNSYVEIGGLVVDERHRGQGIGKALVKAGEAWTLSIGLDDIRVRSASQRVEAHAFYQKFGYRLVKTQMRFEKKINH